MNEFVLSLSEKEKELFPLNIYVMKKEGSILNSDLPKEKIYKEVKCDIYNEEALFCGKFYKPIGIINF